MKVTRYRPHIMFEPVQPMDLLGLYRFHHLLFVNMEFHHFFLCYSLFSLLKARIRGECPLSGSEC